MRFQRVYPVTFWIQGNSKQKEKLEEYLKQDKPDIVVSHIEEELQGFGEEGVSLYKVTGYSVNPQPR